MEPLYLNLRAPDSRPLGPLTVWDSVLSCVCYVFVRVFLYEGGSICNENPCITPSINALGCYAIYQTKDQSVALIMVYETLFYLSKFNKLQTF